MYQNNKTVIFITVFSLNNGYKKSYVVVLWLFFVHKHTIYLRSPTDHVQYLDCVSGATKSWRRALCECSKYGRNMQQRDKIFFVYLKGEFGGVTNVQSSYNKTNETH